MSSRLFAQSDFFLLYDKTAYFIIDQIWSYDILFAFTSLSSTVSKNWKDIIWIRSTTDSQKIAELLVVEFNYRCRTLFQRPPGIYGSNFKM